MFSRLAHVPHHPGVVAPLRQALWAQLACRRLCEGSISDTSPSTSSTDALNNSVRNSKASSVTPFSHPFSPTKRVFPLVRPYENAKARRKREKANPLEKMAIRDAVHFAVENARKFYDETLQLTFHLRLDVRKADQMLRSYCLLPKGTGKSAKVAVFAEGDKAEEAREAGADFVGGAELTEWMQASRPNRKASDIIIATPECMKHIGPIAKKLGSRGTMPNPKQNTIVRDDMKQAVFDAKYRLVTYRTRRHPTIAVVVGKVSFPEEDIIENIVAVVDRVMTERPKGASSSKAYVKACYLQSSQGRSISIKLGQPPFVQPKKLFRGWGILPPRLLKQLELQEASGSSVALSPGSSRDVVIIQKATA